MSRGLGKTGQRILEYLEDKAKRSKVTQLKTIESYASTSELAGKLGISVDCICQSLDRLARRGLIRVYPNGRRRNRYFGSLILPPLTSTELSTALKTILSTNN